MHAYDKNDKIFIFKLSKPHGYSFQSYETKKAAIFHFWEAKNVSAYWSSRLLTHKDIIPV